MNPLTKAIHTVKVIDEKISHLVDVDIEARYRVPLRVLRWYSVDVQAEYITFISTLYTDYVLPFLLARESVSQDVWDYYEMLHITDTPEQKAVRRTKAALLEQLKRKIPRACRRSNIDKANAAIAKEKEQQSEEEQK